MAQTLEQLKQENAKAEEKANATEDVTNTEVVTDEVEQVGTEVEAVETNTEADLSNEDNLDNEVTEEVETELWMQEEKQDSSQDLDTFTGSDMAKLRRKFKAKGEEKDSEIETLKAELELLKQGQQAVAPQQVAQLTRPKLEDFDYDEDKFAEAQEAYLINKIKSEDSKGQQAKAQQSQVQAYQQEQSEKLSSHYERVQDLIASKAITPDAYQNSELIVRRAMEAIKPNQGDAITDDMIARLSGLGEGSEKVIHYLGRTPTQLNRLTNALATNDGFQAMAILGELKGKLTVAPAKKISAAPKPSSRLEGGEPVGDKSAGLARKYREAHKAGDSQKAFDIKYEARQQKIDTSNWS